VLGCAVLVTAISTAPLRSRDALVACAFATLAVLCVTRAAPVELLKRSLVAVPLLATLVLPVLLAGQASHAFELGVRAMLALITALSFATTLSTIELPAALTSLKLPRPLVHMLGTMLRQAGAVQAQGQRILLARKLRGAKGGAMSAEVLASLLTSTAERAERVELAMRLRGADLATPKAGQGLALRDLPLLLASSCAAIAIHIWAR
jgi:energy-coupling factor transporter transmembrane protein EcfT